jgi:hypothetical protein
MAIEFEQPGPSGGSIHETLRIAPNGHPWCPNCGEGTLEWPSGVPDKPNNSGGGTFRRICNNCSWELTQEIHEQPKDLQGWVI